MDKKNEMLLVGGDQLIRWRESLLRKKEEAEKQARLAMAEMARRVRQAEMALADGKPEQPREVVWTVELAAQLATVTTLGEVLGSLDYLIDVAEIAG